MPCPNPSRGHQLLHEQIKYILCRLHIFADTACRVPTMQSHKPRRKHLFFADYTFVLCRDTARRVRIRRVHINDCINKSSTFFADTACRVRISRVDINDCTNKSSTFLADYTFILCRDTACRVPTSATILTSAEADIFADTACRVPTMQSHSPYFSRIPSCVVI